MDNQQKANFYDQLLREYDEKARQVSLINSKFDLSKEDKKEIETLKSEMDVIRRKAASLGSI